MFSIPIIPEPEGWPRPEFDFDLMSDDELISLWGELYAQVVKTGERLTSMPLDAPKQKMMLPTREYWSAVERAMSAYVFMLRVKITPEPEPLVLMNSFFLLAGTLASGTVPTAVTFAGGAGMSVPSPRARDNIAHGIAYVLAAKAGWIDDAAPVKTTAAKFHVSEATVRNWIRKSDAYRPLKAIPTEADYVVSRLEYHGEKYAKSERPKGGGRKAAR